MLILMLKILRCSTHFIYSLVSARFPYSLVDSFCASTGKIYFRYLAVTENYKSFDLETSLIHFLFVCCSNESAATILKPKYPW